MPKKGKPKNYLLTAAQVQSLYLAIEVAYAGGYIAKSNYQTFKALPVLEKIELAVNLIGLPYFEINVKGNEEDGYSIEGAEDIKGIKNIEARIEAIHKAATENLQADSASGKIFSFINHRFSR